MECHFRLLSCTFPLTDGYEMGAGMGVTGGVAGGFRLPEGTATAADAARLGELAPVRSMTFAVTGLLAP
jgi:hypothetical protein